MNSRSRFSGGWAAATLVITLSSLTACGGLSSSGAGAVQSPPGATPSTAASPTAIVSNPNFGVLPGTTIDQIKVIGANETPEQILKDFTYDANLLVASGDSVGPDSLLARALPIIMKVNPGETYAQVIGDPNSTAAVIANFSTNWLDTTQMRPANGFPDGTHREGPYQFNLKYVSSTRGTDASGQPTLTIENSYTVTETDSDGVTKVKDDIPQGPSIFVLVDTALPNGDKTPHWVLGASNNK